MVLINKFNHRNFIIAIGFCFLLLAGCSGDVESPQGQVEIEEWPQVRSALKLILPEEPYASIEEIHSRAAAGDPEAKALLVQEYYRGDLVRHDSAKAIGYLDEALAAGHPIATYFHAFHQTSGIDGTPRMTESTRPLWIKALRELEAVENPSGHVLDAICMIYASGKTADQPDYDKAWEACLKACEHGLPQPWARRAWFHEMGNGNAEESYSEAFRCYAEAARLGSALANHHLARCYLTGLGGEKNREMALGYLARAAQKGVPEAVSDLEKLLNDDLNFLAQGNTRVLVENSQQEDYRFNIGDFIEVPIGSTGVESWRGTIIEKRKGKYKVKVEVVSTAPGSPHIAPCPCSGQEVLDKEFAENMTVWIPESCARRSHDQEALSFSLPDSSSR